MAICPQCGKDGGVMLFMSIAPCDVCLGSKVTNTFERKSWEMHEGFISWFGSSTAGRIIARFRADIDVEIPEDATHGAWEIDGQVGGITGVTFKLNNLNKIDNLRCGKTSSGWSGRFYWKE